MTTAVTTTVGTTVGTAVGTAAGSAPTADPAARLTVQPAVAGLCVAAQRQRDADTMLLELADALAATGHPAESMFTHLISTDAGTQVLACSVRWPTATVTATALSAVWPLLTAAGTPADASVYLDGVNGRSSGSAELAAAACDAAARATARRDGRGVVFPGSDRLDGILTVAQLLNYSAIESVTVLANGAAHATDRIVTRDFVRPVVRNGRLDLLVQPAAGGVLVPFEVPDPTPCCAVHT